jgi:hypothetical protein
MPESATTAHLTAIVMSVTRLGEVTNRKNSRRVKEDLQLDVAGFYRPTAENVSWQSRLLRLGDEVRIRIAEADLASKPSSGAARFGRR